MIKVLQITGGMNLGGAETYIMNIYRHIDREQFQFDFLVFGKEKQFFEDEIISLGGRVIHLSESSVSHALFLYRQMIQIMTDTRYRVVHCHTNYSEALPLFAAEKVGIPIRIAHSHNTRNYKRANTIRKIYMSCCRKVIKRSANRFLGCSRQAIIDFYGSNQKRDYVFAPDAIDSDRITADAERTDYDLKNEISVSNDIRVIGHVGNFGDQKNHKHLILTFNEMLKNDRNIALVLVGAGDNTHRLLMEDLVKDLGISDKVFFLGRRNDVAAIMSCFDLMIFPSLYEGFGIVLLEAQATGLHCLVSENIQPEVDVGLGLIHWKNLCDSLQEWASDAFEIMDCPKASFEAVREAFRKSPFRIQNSVAETERLYSGEKL